MLCALVAKMLKGTLEQQRSDNIEEQILVQQLCSLLLFLTGRQRELVVPRIYDWTRGPHSTKMYLLLAINVLGFCESKARIQTSRYAPNFLIVQLVETLKQFFVLLVTALLNAPPLPRPGFWIGTLALATGTVQYV